MKKYLEENVFAGRKRIYQDTHKGNIYYDVIYDNKNEAYKIIEDNNEKLLRLGYFIYGSGLQSPGPAEDYPNWFVKKFGITPSIGQLFYVVRVYPNVVGEVALFPDYYLGG